MLNKELLIELMNKVEPVDVDMIIYKQRALGIKVAKYKVMYKSDLYKCDFIVITSMEVIAEVLENSLFDGSIDEIEYITYYYEKVVRGNAMFHCIVHNKSGTKGLRLTSRKFLDKLKYEELTVQCNSSITYSYSVLSKNKVPIVRLTVTLDSEILNILYCIKFEDGFSLNATLAVEEPIERMMKQAEVKASKQRFKENEERTKLDNPKRVRLAISYDDITVQEGAVYIDKQYSHNTDFIKVANMVYEIANEINREFRRRELEA